MSFYCSSGRLGEFRWSAKHCLFCAVTAFVQIQQQMLILIPCVRNAFSIIFYVRFLSFPDRRAETGFYPVGLIFVPPCCFVFRLAS